MKIKKIYSHNFAELILKDKNVYQEIQEILTDPTTLMQKKAAPLIKTVIRDRLTINGWTLDASVNVAYNLTINALKDEVGLMVQTGNITRAFYDLLKFQTMKNNSRIEVAVLIVPVTGAAKALGSNIANFERMTNELILYKNIITVPCLIVGIDE